MNLVFIIYSFWIHTISQRCDNWLHFTIFLIQTIINSVGSVARIYGFTFSVAFGSGKLFCEILLTYRLNERIISRLHDLKKSLIAAILWYRTIVTKLSFSSRNMSKWTDFLLEHRTATNDYFTFWTLIIFSTSRLIVWSIWQLEMYYLSNKESKTQN